MSTPAICFSGRPTSHPRRNVFVELARASPGYLPVPSDAVPTPTFVLPPRRHVAALRPHVAALRPHVAALHLLVAAPRPLVAALHRLVAALHSRDSLGLGSFLIGQQQLPSSVNQRSHFPCTPSFSGKD